MAVAKKENIGRRETRIELGKREREREKRVGKKIEMAFIDIHTELNPRER